MPVLLARVAQDGADADELPVLRIGGHRRDQAEGAVSDMAQIIEATRIYRHALRTSERIHGYAIQAGENGPIKIGLAKRPAERFKTLQTANHEELRGLYVWRCLPIEEKLLHEEFEHLRIRGEWFRPDPELLERLRLLGDDFNEWVGW